MQGFLSYDRTFKQANTDYNFIYILAWEPSPAKVTQTLAVYPIFFVALVLPIQQKLAKSLKSKKCQHF